MSLGSRPLALAALAAALLVSTGCSRADTAEPTPTPLPTPTPTPTTKPFDAEAALRQSGQVMQALASFHFRLHHERGNLQLLPGLLIDEVEGDIVNPDKIAVSLDGRYGTGFAIKASLITLGDASYMTNLLTGQWESVAANVSPLGFFNPARGIGAMMLSLEEVRLLSDGEGVYTLSGDLPAEALAPLLGSTLKDTMVKVELTIDAKAFYLLSAKFSGRVTPPDTDDIVRIITVSAFNEPVDIVAPP